MTSKIRALVLADDCNPNWPSLPVVGFNTACALARHADVTLVTHVRNREALQQDSRLRAEVHYIDNEYIAAPLFALGKWIRGGDAVGWTTNVAMNYPTYLSFEREVWLRFRNELMAGSYDVVHRVTPMSPTVPSFLASRCPVPFVLGPLNGGLPWPEEFTQTAKQEKEWLVKARHLHRLLPYYSSTLENSAAILAAFTHTIDDLDLRQLDRVVNFPEVGVDPEVFQSKKRERTAEQLRFLFVGRLVPYKLPDVVVECFRQSPALRRHRLKIVGSGPEHESLARQIAAADLSDCVELVGEKTQSEVGALMRESDVFVFPSIRELGAGVVAEAMASGLCCVGVDYGGPAELLAQGRGVKVSLAHREELVKDFTRELEKLCLEPDRIVELGQRAQRYAFSELSWDVKARRLVEVYRWVLGEREARPDFYGPNKLDIASAA